jgi:hypothetical protein
VIDDTILLEMIRSGRLEVDCEAGLLYSPLSNTPYRPLGSKTRKGYLRCKLYHDGRSLAVMVHRIICIAAHGLPPTPKHVPNHKNHVKSDNRSSNLEWTTNAENMQHAGRAGRLGWAAGPRHPRWKHGKYSVKKTPLLPYAYGDHHG